MAQTEAVERTEWTEEELLATHPGLEALVVDGVRCHGGIDADSRYRPPRTLNRVPAIEAWQRRHTAETGSELLDIELSAWPSHYPSVEQSRFLVQNGVTEPIVAALTRIGTVEGFGSMIRLAPVPDLDSTFIEDTSGTALSHLKRGLFEAHARDEAGHGGEAGHNEMWFLVRDLAFDHPVTEDQTQLMLERMGLSQPGKQAPDPAAMRRQFLENRQLDDVTPELEMLVARMARLLLIEMSAFHTFAWAEELLSDTEMFGGEGKAAEIVGFIRADERSHVEYLRTVLSEIRERTVVGESGRHHPGTEVVGPVWERARAESLGPGKDVARTLFLRELEHTLSDHPDGERILEGFHAVGSVRPVPGGGWAEA